MGSAERVKKFKTLVGEEGSGALAVLVNNAQSGKLREFSHELNNVFGESARLAKEMNATSKGGWKALNSAVESLHIILGEALAPSIDWIASKLNVLGWIDGLTQAFPLLTKIESLTGRALPLISLRLGQVTNVSLTLEGRTQAQAVKASHNSWEKGDIM